MIETEQEDSEIQRKAKKTVGRFQQRLERALREAVELGELGTDFDPKQELPFLSQRSRG